MPSYHRKGETRLAEASHFEINFLHMEKSNHRNGLDDSAKSYEMESYTLGWETHKQTVTCETRSKTQLT